MKTTFDWKKALPFVAAIAIFIGIAMFYCAPALDGKVLIQGDVNNWKGAAQEALRPTRHPHMVDQLYVWWYAYISNHRQSAYWRTTPHYGNYFTLRIQRRTTNHRYHIRLLLWFLPYATLLQS